MSGKNPFLSFGFVSPFMTFIRASISKNLFLGTSLDLNFTENLSLIDDISGNNLITFSRASSGTYVDSDGLIKTSPVNLLTYSDYSQVDATTDAQLEGVVAAPDGTITARRYSAPSAGLDTINKSSTLGTAGKDYTFSVWVRSTGTASEVRLTVGDPDVSTIIQISTQWQRFEITKINNASNFVRSYVQLLNVGDEVEVFGAQLEEGSTATTYIPTTTTIGGAPRFDHDPVTGESLGLLIEESRTNLLQYSEEFNQSIWAKSNTGIVTPNIGTSPDGSLTADRINLGTGFTWVVQSKSFSSGDATFSVYLKSNTGSDQTARLRIFDGTGSNFSPDLTVTSGWQRFSFTRTNLAGGGNVMITKYDAETLDVLAWGAQLEQNASFPTSYIPTTSSTVTRAADVASIEGNKFAKTNLLSYSERFDQSGWSVGGTVSVVPNSALGPNGMMTADQITLGTTGARIGKFNSITTPGQTGTASVYLKNIDHVGQLTLRTGLTGGTSYNLNLSLTSEWVRYELTTTHNGTQNVEFHIRETSANPSGSFLVWGAQLEEGSELTEYTPSVESFVSRASSATYVDDTTGLIKTSPVNQWLYSENVDNWTAAQATVNANVALAPDGTQTADKVTFSNITNNWSIVYQGNFSGTYTWSGWIKTSDNSTKDIYLSWGSPDPSRIRTFTATGEWQRFEAVVTPISQNIHLGNARDQHNISPQVWAGGVFYVWGAQLEEGTTATPYIKTGSTISGAARYENGDLLLEPARTNSFTYSNFAQSTSTAIPTGWSGWNPATFLTSQTLSPDGVSFGLFHGAINTNGGGLRKDLTGLTAGGTYYISYYVKGLTTGELTYFTNNNLIGTTTGTDGGAINSAWFAATKVAFWCGNLNGTGASGGSVVALTTDWQRFGAVVKADSAGSARIIISNNVSDVGTGNEDEGGTWMIWGAQIEAGPFPTSYIPTSGSTVTRAADVSTSALGVDSWYNQSEGTVFADANGEGARIVGLNDATDSNRQELFQSGSNVFCFQKNANVNEVSIFKIKEDKSVFAYKANDYSLTSGGGSVVNDTSATPPTVNQMSIGNWYNYSGQLNGHIARLAYFPTRKTDQELIKITGGTLDLPIITYGITSTGGVFNLRSTGTVDYAVDWDSTGGYESSTSNTLPHTYTAGDYDLVVYSNDVYRPYFDNVTADASQITSVNIRSGANLGTDLTSAWNRASNMTSFVCPFDVFSGVNKLGVAWLNCSGLVAFPLLDFSDVTEARYPFSGCSGITSMPNLDFTSLANGQGLMLNCSALTSVPNFTFSSSLIRLDTGFANCTSLANVPANLFDNCSSVAPIAFSGAWSNCALTAQSIENILVSLDTSGASNITLSIDGGTNAPRYQGTSGTTLNWSAAAEQAFNNLETKGWTISYKSYA